jgi:signal transduction histidine kinase
LPEPRFDACDLTALAEDAARLYGGSTRIQFRVEAERPVPLAWADEGQIQRVLVNLIKNALESMGEEGVVTLRVRREGSADEPMVALEVEDTGPGMDATTLERATAPGFTTKSTGSGLGLTLVQRIVEQHGGRFGMESHAGIGTRAWATLPTAPADATAAGVPMKGETAHGEAARPEAAEPA